MRILLSLIETLSVFVVLFYFYTRSRFFRPHKGEWLGRRGKVSLFLFCSALTVAGNYLGIWLEGGVVANTRAVGSMIAGIVGGPFLGVAVGVTASIHRLSFGGFTAVSGSMGTIFDGLLGGLVHLRRRSRPESLFDWRVALAVTAFGEICHMGFVLLVSRPFNASVEAVKIIGLPMIITNSIGAALFMLVLRERERVVDQVASASSAKALKIAQRTLRLLGNGLGNVALELAAIVRAETGVGAVAITDSETILAFDGLGSDHHVPGNAIASSLTRRSIGGKEVVFADGVHDHYRCSIVPNCPLDSVLIVPLVVDNAVVGTVQLFEPVTRRFRNLNKSLGEGIAALLSSQLLMARYQEQKNLLTVSELKLMHAQVNPHFLFNALNTINAIIRSDPERARELLVQLSHFFRKNLKRNGELSTLAEELEHVGSYLEIEKARFQDRLTVQTEVDPSLLGIRMPTFTLQPLIENALKHGLSTKLSPGTARIRARREDGQAVIEIEDDAGAYVERRGSGLGMRNVDKRLKALLGESYGVAVSCVPEELTRVTVRMPAEGVRQ